MLRRTPQAVFGPGATVFPGGAVDASDAAAARPGRRTRRSRPRAPSSGCPTAASLRRVAAVRECFEEAGHPARPRRATQAHACRRRPRVARRARTRATRRSRTCSTPQDLVDRRRPTCTCSPTGSRPSARRAATTRGSSSPAHRTDKTARTTTASSSRPSGCSPSTRSPRDAARRDRPRPADACAASKRSPVSRRSKRCSTRSHACRAMRSGRLQVVAEASGERVVLPGDDAAPRRALDDSRCPTSTCATSCGIAASRRVPLNDEQPRRLAAHPRRPERAVTARAPRPRAQSRPDDRPGHEHVSRRHRRGRGRSIPARPTTRHIDAIVGASMRDRVRWVLLTHTHPDHWPAAQRIRDETGAVDRRVRQGAEGRRVRPEARSRARRRVDHRRHGVPARGDAHTRSRAEPSLLLPRRGTARVHRRPRAQRHDDGRQPAARRRHDPVPRVARTAAQDQAPRAARARRTAR